MTSILIPLPPVPFHEAVRFALVAGTVIVKDAPTPKSVVPSVIVNDKPLTVKAVAVPTPTVCVRADESTFPSGSVSVQTPPLATAVFRTSLYAPGSAGATTESVPIVPLPVPTSAPAVTVPYV